MSLQGKLHLNLEEANGAPGSYAFEADDRGLFYLCPCGCGAQGFLPFRGRAEGVHASWEWDGKRDTPTLSPSVLRTAGCRWHGYLQRGVWEPC